MLEASRILLHIGYHKTGSTFLQRDYFPLAESGFCLPWPRSEANRVLVQPKALAFDPDSAVVHFAKGLAEADPSKVPVLSNERFSGNPHSGGYDSLMIAERLARVFPGARILMVIREQRSMIRSVYGQYVREGGVESLDGYLHPPRQGELRIPLFDPDFFLYDRLVACYQRLFGGDRVLVLPFEWLRRDRAAFVAALARFAGTEAPSVPRTEPRNVGLSAPLLAVKRRINRLLVRDTLNPAPLSPWPAPNGRIEQILDRVERLVPGWLRDGLELRLTERVQRAVGDRYRESNRTTEALTGLDLAALGYAV